MKHVNRTETAAPLLGDSASALAAQIMPPTAPPEPPVFGAQGEPVFVNRDEIFTYRALDGYSEPESVNAFVEGGKLPPVAERLPAEPLVCSAANMPDGFGTYGDTMRTSSAVVPRAGPTSRATVKAGAALTSACTSA